MRRAGEISHVVFLSKGYYAQEQPHIVSLSRSFRSEIEDTSNQPAIVSDGRSPNRKRCH